MTAKNFSASLAFTLQAEGGWSDNSDDPGGPTMRGITLATYRGHHPGATADDLRKITDADLASIYRHDYWNAVRGDDLPSGVDLSVFDMAVNAGPGRSIKLLQGAANVTADGALGPISMRAIGSMRAVFLIGTLWRRQMAYYEGLATFDTFGRGWTSRTEARRVAALKLSGTISA